MASDLDRATLRARRVPHDQVILGRVYVIHARNGGIGVAVVCDEGIGYRLHREKFGRHFLFVEVDWDDHAFHGTAIPLRLLEELPPDDDVELLAWLADKEVEHREEVDAAWDTVIKWR